MYNKSCVHVHVYASYGTLINTLYVYVKLQCHVVIISKNSIICHILDLLIFSNVSIFTHVFWSQLGI